VTETVDVFPVNATVNAASTSSDGGAHAWAENESDDEADEPTPPCLSRLIVVW
jgi:hypothetical protein